MNGAWRSFAYSNVPFLVRSYFPEVSFRLIGMKLIVGECRYLACSGTCKEELRRFAKFNLLSYGRD